MDYWKAILLGAVQGLTEFLPVSSSGHLVILQHVFELNPESQAMIMFDLAVHMGTVLAVLFYFRKSIIKFFAHLGSSLRGLNDPLKLYHSSASIRFSVLAFTAIFATGIVYILFHEVIDQGFEKPWIVALCWVITGIVLVITDSKRRTRKSLRDFGIMAALLVGLAQGAAMFPGISRSGSTICVAVLLGLHRRWAGEFSFLIGVPTIIGATLIEGIQFFRDSPEAIAWGPTLAGSLVSALVGLAALALLIWALRKAKLKVFAIYCFLLAAGTFTVLLFSQSATPS